MSDQTTAPVEQSEQPKDVAQPEATPEVKETVLAEATTEQQQEEPKVINFKELINVYFLKKYNHKKAIKKPDKIYPKKILFWGFIKLSGIKFKTSKSI